VILRELAGKLMELAIEAGGDLDEDEHQLEEEAANSFVFKAGCVKGETK
jgi:hypothetical protein